MLTECGVRQYFDEKIDVKGVVERVPKIRNGDGVGGLDGLHRPGHGFEYDWLYRSGQNGRVERRRAK